MKRPVCMNHEKCFGNKLGKCIVLSDNDFGGKECPFYKTRAQFEAERKIYGGERETADYKKP